MTDWFVRPDASHGGTGSGADYANAFQGWPNILWGTASNGVGPGDTLYVCGTHSYSANLTMGNHLATAGSRVTIRGDHAQYPGSITLSSGAFLDANKNYTTVTKLPITALNNVTGSNPCISPGGTPLIGLWITDCTLTGGLDALIKFRAFNNWGFHDCIIEGNTFNGGVATELGCIQWYVTSAVLSTIKRLTIRNNTFQNNTARATILLRSNYLDVASAEDVLIYGNKFLDCKGAAVESECKKTVGGVEVGANKGIRIYDNTLINQGLNGILGGGFSLTGYELSTTPGFGTNDIYGNWCSGLHGLTGFCNPMFGTYRIFNNYAENITTIDIDGCGVLFDHQCHDSVAFSNEFRDIHGKPTDNFSTGFGILVLDAIRCKAYGNLIVNCLHGVAFGNKQSGTLPSGQSSEIYNNTFVNCAKSGAYLVGGADNTANIVRNNIFTTTDNTAPAVKVNSAAWTGESNNCFHGFGASSNHTLHASTVTSNPQLNGAYRPASTAIVRKGIYLGGRDVYGKPFHKNPNIGAVEQQTKPR